MSFPYLRPEVERPDSELLLVGVLDELTELLLELEEVPLLDLTLPLLALDDSEGLTVSALLDEVEDEPLRLTLALLLRDCVGAEFTPVEREEDELPLFT